MGTMLPPACPIDAKGILVKGVFYVLFIYLFIYFGIVRKHI